MSRPNSAAIPGRGRREWAPTETFAHPGEAAPLGCPNCLKDGHLEYVVPAEHFNAIRAVEITEGRITYPQVETITLDSSTPDVTDEARPTGIRCTYCHWAYRGPNPSTRLVRVR